MCEIERIKEKETFFKGITVERSCKNRGELKASRCFRQNFHTKIAFLLSKKRFRGKSSGKLKIEKKTVEKKGFKPGKSEF